MPSSMAHQKKVSQNVSSPAKNTPKHLSLSVLGRNGPKFPHICFCFAYVKKLCRAQKRMYTVSCTLALDGWFPPTRAILTKYSHQRNISPPKFTLDYNQSAKDRALAVYVECCNAATNERNATHTSQVPIALGACHSTSINSVHRIFSE